MHIQIEFQTTNDNSVALNFGGAVVSLTVEEARGLMYQLDHAIEHSRANSAAWRSEQRAKFEAYLIDDLEISVRSFNCLAKAGITTVGELADYGAAALRDLPHFGMKSLREVRNVLDGMGVDLAP